MLKKGLILLMLISWLLTPALSLGQEIAPGRWWRLPQVVEKLRLTEGQRRDLDELYISNRRKLLELKSILERERFELESLLEMDPLNEAAVMAQFKKLEAARANLAGIRFAYFLEVRKILGAERLLRLETIYRELRQKFSGGPMERH